jgi:SWI/SNF-related matrix-associated actin-dependent regulator of chromatin subfamily A3
LASLIGFIQISPLNTLSEFRKHIITPLLKGRDQGSNNLRILLDAICLRRTKKLLNLPDSYDEDRQIEFTPLEMKFYKETQAEMIATVKQHDSQSRNTKDFFGIFQLQLQLRRICNHGTFQKALSKSPTEGDQFDPEQAFEMLQEKGLQKCTYCEVVVSSIQEIEDKRCGSFTKCGHLFCSECVPKYKAVGIRSVSGSSRECSLCMRKVSGDFIMDDGLHKDGPGTIASPMQFPMNGCETSSKVIAVINDLKINNDQGKR